MFNIQQMPGREFNPTNFKGKEKIPFIISKYDNENNFRGYYLNKKLFVEYLRNEGFYLYKLDTSTLFMKLDKKIIDIVDKEYIKNYVISYIDKTSDDEIKAFFYDKASWLFKYEELTNLGYKEDINLYEPVKDEVYFFFNNLAYKITEDQITPVKYEDLDFYIWKKQIKEYNIEILENGNVLSYKNEFYNLLNNITKVTGSEEDSTGRFNALLSALGYLIHPYRDPAQTKAIIFLDEKITDDLSEANGGTCKSLIAKSLQYVRNLVMIDGKNINDPSKNQFIFQRIGVDTQIVCIDDIREKFRFENLYSAIIEGYEVEKKQMQRYQQFCKTLITTNFSLYDASPSAERRKFQIEFSPYYSNDYTPLDQFGHRLFDDWDEIQWNYFFNFMFYAVQYYLKHKLKTYSMVNVRLKELYNQTRREFVEFIEARKEKLMEDGLDIKTLFIDYKEESEDSEVKQTRFTRWLSLYAKYLEMELVEIKRDNNKTRIKKLIAKGCDQPVQNEIPEGIISKDINDNPWFN